MDRFECQGCHEIVTADADVQDHKNRHGLIINIGPDDPEAERERRERANAADGAKGLATRTEQYRAEYSTLLTPGEIALLWAAEGALRRIEGRLGQ
jgi:hypothetical protein